MGKVKKLLTMAQTLFNDLKKYSITSNQLEPNRCSRHALS
jgi:hypothetical protein